MFARSITLTLGKISISLPRFDSRVKAFHILLLPQENHVIARRFACRSHAKEA